MIHAREDYNRIQDPENKIPDNDPVFLLRGQDKFAPDLLLRYASNIRNNNGDISLAILAEDHAKEMLRWQEKVRSKNPDL